MKKTNVRFIQNNQKSKNIERDKSEGITLIALVITIIVLLILAGVTIATLTGDNGILTKVNEASIENTHATVKDAISLAYNEYQIQINTTENATSFWDFLVGKNYIDETTGIVDTEKLTGEKLSLGKGSENSDVYKIEKENGYILKYYNEESIGETLWDAKQIELKELSDEELEEKLDQTEKPAEQTDTNDVGIDEFGNVVNLDLWSYVMISENTCKITSNDVYSLAYKGDIKNGAIEGNIPAYIEREGNKYKVIELGSYTLGTKFSAVSSELTVFPKIPRTIEIISGAFSYCSALKEVIIPDNVLEIGFGTFQGCSNLEKVTLPNNLKKIGGQAFWTCGKLDNIVIPQSVISIGGSAFSDTLWYDNQPDGEIYIGNVFYDYKGQMPENTEIQIKDGTVSISEYAFSDNTGLTSITIPSTVVEIGDYAFSNCNKLTNIIINKPKNTIEGAKWGADNATVTWTDGVTE